MIPTIKIAVGDTIYTPLHNFQWQNSWVGLLLLSFKIWVSRHRKIKKSNNWLPNVWGQTRFFSSILFLYSSLKLQTYKWLLRLIPLYVHCLKCMTLAYLYDMNIHNKKSTHTYLVLNQTHNFTLTTTKDLIEQFIYTKQTISSLTTPNFLSINQHWQQK